MSEITNKIKAIIIDRLDVQESQCVPEANFNKDLQADSLDLVQLMMEFEREFNIVISDADAEKINTVGDAITYLEACLKA